MQLTVNGKDYQLQEGETFICLPTMIVSNMLLSPQHKVGMIGFSTKFLQQTIKRGRATEKALYYIYKTPSLPKHRKKRPKTAVLSASTPN